MIWAILLGGCCSLLQPHVEQHCRLLSADDAAGFAGAKQLSAQKLQQQLSAASRISCHKAAAQAAFCGVGLLAACCFTAAAALPHPCCHACCRCSVYCGHVSAVLDGKVFFPRPRGAAAGERSEERYGCGAEISGVHGSVEGGGFAAFGPGTLQHPQLRFGEPPWSRHDSS